MANQNNEQKGPAETVNPLSLQALQKTSAEAFAKSLHNEMTKLETEVSRQASFGNTQATVVYKNGNSSELRSALAQLWSERHPDVPVMVGVVDSITVDWH
jgi:hypothetical protein